MLRKKEKKDVKDLIDDMKKKILLLLVVNLIFILPCNMLYASSADGIRYSVSIVGAVPNPGVYRLPPFTRVSELYQMATVSRMPEQDEVGKAGEEEIKASLRKISLMRNDEKQIIDLAKFYHAGDMKNNPYLEDGDIIHVSPMLHSVTLRGQIQKPGVYEILDYTILSEIIDFAHGFTPQAELREIYIHRYQTEEPELIRINYVNEKDRFRLKNQDEIVIHTKVELRSHGHYVHIQGQVKFPGMYPYQEDKTTLLEIIESAGGILDNADLKNAYVQRRGEIEGQEQEILRLQEIDYNIMNHIEREFLKSSWRYSTNKVQIDLERLLETKDEEYDLLLNRNDLIYLPDKTKTITITGHVKNPGQITYLPNSGYKEYIEKAGGYSWNVDRRNIRIIRFHSGEWVKPDEDTILFPGDMLVVPEKKVYDTWELSKDVLQVLVQFTTLIVLINNIATK